MFLYFIEFNVIKVGLGFIYCDIHVCDVRYYTLYFGQFFDYIFRFYPHFCSTIVSTFSTIH